VGHFPNTLEEVDQSQHTDTADQSEHSVVLRSRDRKGKYTLRDTLSICRLS